MVTFERKHLPRTQLPRWDKNESNIGDIKLHVTHTGTIESDGKGCLQVDFANWYLYQSDIYVYLL